MSIYKSSYNKEQKEKIKPEKIKKEKPIKAKKAKSKTNGALISLIIFSLLFLIFLIPTNFIKSFFLGVVGLSIYPITFVGIVLSIVRLTKKSIRIRKKYVILLTIAVAIIWAIFHLILTSRLSTTNFGKYLVDSYTSQYTAGGILFSLLTYPMIKYLTTVGAYIIFGIALAIVVGLIVDYVNVERSTGYAVEKTSFTFSDIEDFQLINSKPIEENKPANVNTQEQDPRKLAKQKLGLDKSESVVISSSMPTYDLNLKSEKPLSKREYILTPLDPILPSENIDDFYTSKKVSPARIEELKREQSLNEIKPTETIVSNEEPEEPVEIQLEYVEEVEDADDVILESDELEEYETAFTTDATITEEEKEEFSKLENLNTLSSTNEEIETNIIEEIDIRPEENEYVDEYSTNYDRSDLGSTVDKEIVRPSIDISKFNLPNTVSKPVSEQLTIVKKDKQPIPPYIAPPVELLKFLDNPIRISDEEIQDNIDRLEQVLDDFKVPAKVNNVQVGPAVTRYELTMPRGISVNKIAMMADDIAMTLASNGAIRVEAPIPGKNSVGIEVPNNQVSPVSLRELIDSDDFRNRGNPLSFVLGRDINGDIIFCNLDKMPHVLVAGSTGSGKSVCLNTMLLSMCYKAGPQDLRLILVDPKMVEFTTYNGLPHLLIPEVITNKNMTINALDWAIHEMDRRYAMFSKNRVVNISEFNKSEMVKSKQLEKIPYIVIVVDELADLMLEAKREIDDRINKLAAKARAAGIHLVLATQRPSVDVITGTVKANLPSRIAFALTNFMDSKTILDQSGAEKLLGKGDMLFRPQDKPEPFRVQGAYVSNEEIQKVVEFIKEKNNPVYDEDTGRAIHNPHQSNSSADISGAKDAEFDPVLKEALKWFIQVKQASGSMITRRFSVGFNRAGRIMDQMEQAGFIGPQEGSKPRQVLITIDEYKAIFGDDE